MSASIRYIWDAVLIKETDGTDEYGNPIDPVITNTVFKCDYQPNDKEAVISDGVTTFPVRFKIFVKPSISSSLNFERNDKITCNGLTGTIVDVFAGKFNCEITCK